MTAFKVGDIVAKTDTAVVIEECTDRPSARIRWPNGVEEWVFEWDYALVESGLAESGRAESGRADSKPSWNDVEVGDTVKVKVTHTGEVFEALSTSKQPEWGAYVDGAYIHGVYVDSLAVERAWELLSITKPKPALPTKPGSVIRVKRTNGLVHRREAVACAGLNWVADTGNILSDARVEDLGWEVVE